MTHSRMKRHNLENDQTTIHTTFKALMRETSVYKYYVELKEGAFTEKGFFDLAKVPGLRVTGAGQFLKNLRIKNSLKRKDIAEILGFKSTTVKDWELNRRRMPLQLLIKIAEIYNVSRDAIYSLIDQGQFSLRRARLPVKFEEIRDIIHYLYPVNCADKRGQISLLKCCSETRNKICGSLKINPWTYRHQTRFGSEELSNFLKTFFSYTKVPKLHPPLIREVKGWYDDGIDLKRAIIIPCLQSDGSIDQNKKNTSFKAVLFYGKNRRLHNLFVDAMYFEYQELPSSYFTRSSGNYTTRFQKKLSTDKIVTEIMYLAGNTKTTPAHGQTTEEYLKEPQPHLDYLTNASKKEQQIALRIWASAEGSISIEKINGLITPVIYIGCAHPVLAEQLKYLANRHGIRLYFKKNKQTWSGIVSLCGQTFHGCINFLKLGGFIKGIKISSNSPYHEGIDKDILNLGILEYVRQRRRKKSSQELSIDVHHHNVNKIIRNEEYKSADYYIDYFS